MTTNNQSGIYRIKNTETGAMYIGRTAETFTKRWKRHRWDLKAGRHDNEHLQRSYNKHGPRAFEYKTLEVIPQGDMTDQEFNDYMNAREIILIAEHNTFENGYNLTEGGEGHLGYDVSEATKAKISAALMGNTHNVGREHTDEARANMSAAQVGNKRGVGRIVSNKTRAKISAANKGRKYSAESRANMAAGQKGKTLSEEHRTKISKALKGKTPWNRGIPTSEETRAKLSKATKAYWERKREENDQRKSRSTNKEASNVQD